MESIKWVRMWVNENWVKFLSQLEIKCWVNELTMSKMFMFSGGVSSIVRSMSMLLANGGMWWFISCTVRLCLMSAVKLHTEHLNGPFPPWFFMWRSRFHLYCNDKSERLKQLRKTLHDFLSYRRSEVAQHALYHRHWMVLDVLAESRLDVRHIRAFFASIKFRVAVFFLLVMN